MLFAARDDTSFLLIAFRVLALGCSQLSDFECLLGARMCMHMRQEASSAFVFLGGSAHHLDLLFGGEIVCARREHDGIRRSGFFVNCAFGRRGH